MQIEIPEADLPQLMALAEAAGFGDDVQNYILHRSLAEEQNGPSSNAPKQPDVMLPRDKWKAEFDALLAGIPRRNTTLYDSPPSRSAEQSA